VQTYLCRYHILTTILYAGLNGEHVYMLHRVSMPGLEPMAMRSQPPPQAQGVVYELVYMALSYMYELVSMPVSYVKMWIWLVQVQVQVQ